MNKKIVISDIEIEVRKKRIKNMYLTVLRPSGRVRISAPLKTGDDVIKEFAGSRIDWIRKQLSKIERHEMTSKQDYLSGETIFLWGKILSLEVLNTSKAGRVEQYPDKVLMHTRENSTREHREKLLNEWYRTELKTALPALFNKWEGVIGIKANEFNVKNMRTRWGTCNVRDKRIWINLQLAKKPFECLEYVVVHELVHLIEKEHSDAFWRYMDLLLPEWRSTIEKLK